MREVTRSVKPYWFFLICEGIKTVEVGKDKPKAEDWNKIVNLYCSKDKKSFERIPKEFQEKYRKYLGKVGARFLCNNIRDFSNRIINTHNRYELQTVHEILANSRLTHSELCEYLNEREDLEPFYLWHISDLVIYDKPRELYDFLNYNKHLACISKNCFSGDCWGCHNNAIMIRPPQSWCYVDVNESEVKSDG